MYDNILIPTDGSETSQKALDHALELADRYNATIHTLYVIDLEAVDIGLGTEQVQRIKEGRYKEMDEIRQRVESATGEIAKQASERGIECIEGARAGRPHASINDYATDNDIDVIVMASHGRSGVRRMLLGSVTEKVIRVSDVPVLVVKVND